MGADNAERLAALLATALDRLRSADAAEEEHATPTGIYDAPGPPGGL